MMLFLLVTDTASSSSFMNCLLSSLHFILWDLWLHLWEFWTYGEISNPQTVLCGLSNFFAINFNSFEYVFLLPCWSSLPFSFPTQLCIPISPDSVNPMFQGHTVRGEAIFCSQPANLDLQKNGGQGEGFRYPGPCWKEGESIAEAAPLDMGLRLPRKGVLSCVCT